MRERTPNHLLRQQRELRNESREEFAAAIRRTARKLGENVGCTKRHVAAWEDGEILWPRPVYRRVLSALLGMTPAELGFVPRSAKTAGGGTVGGMDVNRRGFTAGMVGSVLPLAGGFPKESAPTLVDVGTDLKLVPSQLSALEQRVGGAAMLDMATTQLRMFQQLSRLSDQSGTPQGRELLSAIGWVGRIAAWSAFDSGDPNLARVLFGEARAYALMSGDSLLLADLANLLSHQELYLRNPAGALSVISGVHREAARELRHPKVRALFRIRAMQAYALLGDRNEVRAYEREAMASFDEAESGADELWWLGFLSRGEVSRQMGSAYLDLGDHQRAEPFLREATDVSRTDFTRNDTYWRIRLAQTLVLKGEHEEATAFVADALRHYWVDRSRRIHYQVVQFARMLDPRQGGAAARNFHDELRDSYGEIAAELSSRA
ncbi:hypothetical protein [Streptomyces sp. NPDC006527]|uniref:hypothetical protein n=1 Tax=Streptomyces sp. NPDC006527 TaxID=3364749 RepID=UPI0036A5F2C6